MSEPYNTVSRHAWQERGIALFGRDTMKWKFRCPECGRTQGPLDFAPFTKRGAVADMAYSHCLSRFDGATDCGFVVFASNEAMQGIYENGVVVRMMPFAE